MQCDIPISNDGGNTEAMRSDMPIAGILRAAKGGKKKHLLKHSPPYFHFHSEHESLIVSQSQIFFLSLIMRGKLGKNSFFHSNT